MTTPMKSALHEISSDAIATKQTMPVVIGVLLGTLLLGVLTGFGVQKFMDGKISKTADSALSAESDSAKQSSGILDKKTFKDQAEGILREGGFEGEGSFHLERPGGKSQNVYLTSTTVDLTQYLGKKVRTWGQTFSAEKAGWLMDVGYIELVK